MIEKKHIFTRKKALLIVLICAALIILFIGMRWLSSARDNLSTPEGRQSFLMELGWEVDMSSETQKAVTVPYSLDGVMVNYNRMQQEQGYHLSEHLGEKCEQYTYILTNYPDSSQTVYLTIYVQGRKIIAGDIHTTAIDGFMHGIKRSN